MPVVSVVLAGLLNRSSSMLRQRILTALVLAGLVLAALFWLSTREFAVILGVVVILSAREWATLSGCESAGQQAYAGGTLLLLMLAWIMRDRPQWFLPILGLSVLFWSTVSVWLWQQRHDLGAPLEQRLLLGIGIPVLIIPWLAMTVLHAQAGPAWVLFLFLIVWVADSGAYFAGRRWGRQRLAPAISPGKTWEGVYGALMAGAGLAVIGAFSFGLGLVQGLLFVVLCLLTTMLSITGDLFESLIKRQRGVKDSGDLLPGHGGILDRVDSLTAAAPGLVLGWWLLQSGQLT